MRAETGLVFALRRYKTQQTLFVQKHLSSTYHATENSKCSCGRRIWYWYLPLTSSATKQVLASYPAPPFPFAFPHFRTSQITRYVNWTVLRRTEVFVTIVCVFVL